MPEHQPVQLHVVHVTRGSLVLHINGTHRSLAVNDRGAGMLGDDSRIAAGAARSWSNPGAVINPGHHRHLVVGPVLDDQGVAALHDRVGLVEACPGRAGPAGGGVRAGGREVVGAQQHPQFQGLDGKRCTGVRYSVGGAPREAHAAAEQSGECVRHDASE